MWAVKPDFASNRTQEQREAHYLGWLKRSERQDTPEVRALFFRRYQRPSPPKMPHFDLVDIRGSWTWHPSINTFTSERQAA